MRFNKHYLTVSILLSLSACGGSSDDNPNNSTGETATGGDSGTANSEPAAITSNSSRNIAGFATAFLDFGISSSGQTAQIKSNTGSSSSRLAKIAFNWSGLEGLQTPTEDIGTNRSDTRELTTDENGTTTLTGADGDGSGELTANPNGTVTGTGADADGSGELTANPDGTATGTGADADGSGELTANPGGTATGTGVDADGSGELTTNPDGTATGTGTGANGNSEVTIPSVTCESGGAINFEVGESDGQPADSQLEVGDFFQVTFDSCTEPYSDDVTGQSIIETTNSTFRIEISQVISVNDFSYNLTMDEKISTSNNSHSSSTQGSGTASFKLDGNGGEQNSGTMQFASTFDGESISSDPFTYTYIQSGNQYTYDYNATVTGSAINGTVTVATGPAFNGTIGNEGDENIPTSGKLTVTGNNSSIVLDAGTGNPNTIQITTDDNGTVTSEIIDWNELEDPQPLGASSDTGEATTNPDGTVTGTGSDADGSGELTANPDGTVTGTGSDADGSGELTANPDGTATGEDASEGAGAGEDGSVTGDY